MYLSHLNNAGPQQKVQDLSRRTASKSNLVTSSVLDVFSTTEVRPLGKTQKLASHMVPHGPMGLSLLEISQLRHGSVHLFDVDLWDHLGLGQSWEQNWIKLGQRCEAS